MHISSESASAKTFNNTQPEVKSGYPLRIAMIAALGGLLFGFEVSVISGAEKTIQQLWSLSSGWLGFTVASSLIGTVLGSLIVGSPAQRYGRKKVLTSIAVMYLVASIGCGVAQAWLLFVVFRFIGGIAVGASSVVGPMYISEIAPAHQRGRLAVQLVSVSTFNAIAFSDSRLSRIRSNTDSLITSLFLYVTV